MSLGSTVPIATSAAGAPLAQSTGAEMDRIRTETSARRAQVHSELKALAAAGVAASDGEQKSATERDADGRRIWEIPATAQRRGNRDVDIRASRGDTSESGTQLDLCG